MKKRLLYLFILIVYIAILIKVLVFKDVPLIRSGPIRLRFGGSHEAPANFIPFKTIVPYLLGEKGFLIAFINLVGNIVLLIPIGFLVPLIYRNMTWKKTLLLAIAAGLALEVMQAVLRVGIFDIDDVMLNGLGVILGYWAFTFVAKKLHSMKIKKINVVSVIVIAAVSVFLSLGFFQKPQQPVDVARVIENKQSDSLKNTAVGIFQGPDPCKGSGGTGQIVSVGKNTFTIKLNNGIDQIIKISNKTTFKNSAGPISASDLKKGDRVTVVVMPDKNGVERAAAVLVCSTPR